MENFLKAALGGFLGLVAGIIVVVIAILTFGLPVILAMAALKFLFW